MDLARNLKADSVSRLNPQSPIRISPQQTVGEAVQAMRQAGVGCILVCQDNRVIGIFSERDLMRRVLAEGKPLTLPIRDCMTPHPVTIHPKDSVATAIRKMEEGGYRHLPVVNDGGRPVGMLSVKQVVHYLVEHFPAAVYNLPPDPDAIPQQRDGA